MAERTKIYFLSDAHLGVDYEYSSEKRETLLIHWLDNIKKDAKEINLVGDILDFWFEFKYFVPKGAIRLFVKLRELSDSGIAINYYTGNHDMWIFDYIPKITGANLIKKHTIKTIGNKKFFIDHGDALGPYDIKQNFFDKIFSSHFFQIFFKLVHPSISFRIAKSWSDSSRKKHKYPDNIDPGYEWLVRYAKTILQKEHIDFFIFGHRHLAFQLTLENDSLFTNLGDWISNFTYAVYDGEKMELLNYKENLHLIK